MKLVECIGFSLSQHFSDEGNALHAMLALEVIEENLGGRISGFVDAEMVLESLVQGVWD